MAASNLTDTIGSIDPVALAKQYPYLATKNALQTAKAAGMDTSKPKSLITAMGSNAFQRTLQETAGEKNDNRILNRIMGSSTTPTFNPNATPEQAATQGYQASADSLRRTSMGQGIIGKQVLAETERLSKLADFNETAYKRQRIAEMKPTEDIDRQILDLRNRALFSKAAMYSNMSSLPYGTQGRAVAAMQKVFIDQINELQDLRQARISDAESKIQEEVNSHTNRVDASQARITGLEKAISILKDQGASEQAIAQLTMDHSKEQERLRKARAGSGNLASSKDVITQALTQKYIEEHAGEAPGTDARQLISQQAEFIAKNRQDLTTKILGANGDFTKLQTTQTTSKQAPARNIFQQMMLGAFINPNTTVSETTTTDALGEAGFGVPFSAADEAELTRKRDLAGLK